MLEQIKDEVSNLKEALTTGGGHAGHNQPTGSKVIVSTRIAAGTQEARKNKISFEEVEER